MPEKDFIKNSSTSNSGAVFIPHGMCSTAYTIPDTLNPVAYQNQKAVYTILFKAAAETLSELSADKKYLGA